MTEHRLIALTDKEKAANELYQALKKLMEMRHKCYIPNSGNWWDEMAEAAIAKAEGR